MNAGEPRRIGVGVAAGLAAVLFATRALNFDEALALRGGYAFWAGWDIHPAFLTPATLVVGAVARLVDDPGAAIALARMPSWALWLATAALVARRRASTVAIFALLALASPAFLAHGLEARYDVFASLGLPLAAVLWRRGGRGVVACGGLLALAAVSGPKPALPALALLAVCWTTGRCPADRRRLVATFGAVAALFAVSLALAGRWDALVGTWRLYLTITREGAGAPMLFPALAAEVSTLAVVGLVLFRAGRSPPPELLALAAAQLLVALAHPLPFKYLLAPVTGALATAAAVAWDESEASRLRGRTVAAAMVLALGVQSAVVWTGSTPDVALRTIRQRYSGTVALLRALAATTSPAMRVLDPSGLAYFRRPCGRVWYVDHFTRAHLAPEFARLAQTGLSGCDAALRTYRTALAGPEIDEALAAAFVPMKAPILLTPGLRDAFLAADALALEAFDANFSWGQAWPGP